jgi:hypothetical protein
MGSVDARHGDTWAYFGVETHDGAVWVALCESFDEMDLGTDSDRCSRSGGFYESDDEVGGP